MKLSNRRRGSLRIGNPYAHRARSSSQTANLLVNKTTITGSFVFIVAFFAAFFSSSVLTPVKTSDALNNISTDVSFGGYFVKVQSDDVAMRLITNPVGAMTVVKSTVKTVTNSQMVIIFILVWRQNILPEKKKPRPTSKRMAFI